jgi:hypothetical protein
MISDFAKLKKVLRLWKSWYQWVLGAYLIITASSSKETMKLETNTKRTYILSAENTCFHSGPGGRGSARPCTRGGWDLSVPVLSFVNGERDRVSTGVVCQRHTGNLEKLGWGSRARPTGSSERLSCLQSYYFYRK